MTAQAEARPIGAAREARGAVVKRSAAIGIIAFLTLIDLFGSQALLPSLVEAYGVTPSEMGVAVNASTIGMAAAGLLVALFGASIDRRFGVAASLALLSIPTVLLGLVDDLTTFALLRVAQGVFMAAAFTLTLTYLSEVCTVTAARGAMAAYITGNVASNLFGRLLASEAAWYFDISGAFYVFAALNLAGAVFAYWYFSSWSSGGPSAPEAGGVLSAFGRHLRNPALQASFTIGFLILFLFIGVFTYVNFVLAEPPFSLTQSQLGLVYLVFAPSIFTTPVAAGAVARFGPRAAFLGAMAVSILGLGLLLIEDLIAVLAGLALIGAGLFFAQAAATGFVGRAADGGHAAANGLYLTSYYLGGLGGAVVVGSIFAAAGWSATVLAMIAIAVLAAALGAALKTRGSDGSPEEAV